jgi:hypothetical protein
MVYARDNRSPGEEVTVKMGSKILAVVAGIVVAVLIVFVVETAGHEIWPTAPPPGVDPHDPEVLKAIMPSIPVGAKVAVIVGWVAGAFGGGFVAAKIARNARFAWIVGGIQLAFGAITMFSIPHPLAMLIAGLLLPLPAAMLGGMLAAPRNAQAQG